MSAKKIRWGILSTASIGTGRVIPAMQQSRNGVVAAIASREQERAQQAADALGIPRAHGSYEALLADPEIDAIYNPLPNSMHMEWSIRCAEAGIPVLCEKPLAVNAAEGEAMVVAFARRDLLLAEGFMYRFHPQTQKALELVRSGAIGDLVLVNASFNFPIDTGDTGNIRLSRELEGGSLMDVGCYCISVARLMTGEEPTQARAISRVGAGSGVIEVLGAVLDFPSGAIGVIDCGLRSHRVQSYDLRGTRGRIRVETAFVAPPDETTCIEMWRGNGEYSRISIAPANSYTLMAEDFADALLQGRPPKYPPGDGVANMRVIDMLR